MVEVGFDGEGFCVDEFGICKVAVQEQWNDSLI